MQDDYKRIVPPPPLHGASRARLTFIATSQEELQEPLRGDEGHGEDEKCGSAQQRKNTCSAEKPGPIAETTP